MKMGEIIILFRKGKITVEKRTVQDLFIQWNGWGEPDWSKLLEVGLPFIFKLRNPKDRLIIYKNECAWNFMVSCNEWS